MRELQLCAYKYIFILIHYYIESENIYFLNDQVLIFIVQSQGKKKDAWRIRYWQVVKSDFRPQLILVPRVQFGALRGVLKTRVGFSGGTTQNPTYRTM